MGDTVKIKPESIVIQKAPNFMDGTSDGLTQADIAKMQSPLKNAPDPITISGKTSDGRDFRADGSTTDNKEFKTANVTRYKIGNMDYKLTEPLPVKIEGGKLDKDSLVNFEELASKGSTKVGGIFSKKTIRSEYVSDKKAALSNDDPMKTALAQANQANANFKSAYNTVPSVKSGEKSTGRA